MNSTISGYLELFNRKERYWLFKNAFGPSVDRLHPAFCKNLASKLLEGGRFKSSIDEDAWWAVDYHFDWLIGALRLHGAPPGSSAIGFRTNADKSITGTQEDIDLVIASGRDLILIEAKAFGSWSISQLKSKLIRLETLQKEALAAPSETRVTLHYVLTSPKDPSNKVKNLPWPEWALPLIWLPLRVDLKDEDLLTIGRTDKTGLQSVLRQGR